MAAAHKIIEVVDSAKSLEGTMARTDVLSWDDYFMSIAFLTGMRSKDPSTQVGAVIVNGLSRIIGVGYNGFPSGIEGGALPWAKSPPGGPGKDSELATKHPYVVHAEVNAVMNKNAESCRGCRLYTTLFPCNECAKVIIQAGIREVIFASDKHHGRITSKASRELFRLAGVQTRHHAPGTSMMNLTLRYPEDEPSPEPGAAREAPEGPGRRVCGGCGAARRAGPRPGPPGRRGARATGTEAWARIGVPLTCGVVALLYAWRRSCSS